MKSQSRIYIYVQDHKLKPYVEANVQIRRFQAKKWRKVLYDKTIEQFVLKGLDPGKYELRVQGKKGWEDDLRIIKLHAGDNFMHSTLAPSTAPYYLAAEGEKVYFQPDENKILLYAQGRDLHKKLPKLIKKMGLDLGKPVVPLGQEAEHDNASFLISLPESSGERDKTLIELQNTIDNIFPNAGLTGGLAAPMFRGEEIIEGLTNELIVKFKSEVTEAEAERIAKRYRFQVLRKITYLGNAYLWRSAKLPTYDLINISHELMEQFPVLYAEPNIIFQISADAFDPNDFLYPEQQHFQVINADDAWDTLDDINVNVQSGSTNVTIAVVDSGVDPTHPDFTGNLSDGTNKISANFDFVNMANQAFVNLGSNHGTQCASSAAGAFNNGLGASGLAGNCHLIGIRQPRSWTGLAMADAWIWAAGFQTGSVNPNFPPKLAKGADVISNSWGVNGGALTPAIKDAVDFLTVYGRGGKGCVVCFSIGNNGYIDFTTNGALRRMYANYERTIAVGASINQNPTNPVPQSDHADQNGNVANLPAVLDTRAYYSPYGPSLDIVAPSHTANLWNPNTPLDMIVSAVRVNQGNWTGQAVASTNTTAPLVAGNTIINVNNSAGFVVGEFTLIGTPGVAPREFVLINAVGIGQLTVDALQNAYAIGTQVSTGPNDYSRAFGGTSHSCPTIAGAAALILSLRPELTWVQVREILRTTAVRIDAGQANAIGRWVDNDGDGVAEFSRWYGYGRLDVDAAVIAARDLDDVPDVVVRDNLDDNGTVPSGGWHAHSPDIWVRKADDPIPALAYNVNPPHENPVRGQDNYVFMRVKNVGAATTNEVYLRTMITHYPGFEFRYPNEWQPTTRPGAVVPNPLVTGTYLIGEERIDNLADDADIIVKMTWTANLIPPQNVLVAGVNVKWHPCILAEVSPHDGPAPAGATFDVKRDNNLAHRNIRIDEPADSDDFAVAVVAGTSDAAGIDAVIVDRSMLPTDYQVFVRIADERHMLNWLELLKAGELSAVGPLPGGLFEKPEQEPEWPEKTFAESCCKVTLLDPARIGIECCDGNALVVKAPARTEIEMLCRSGIEALGHPNLRLGKYQGQQVILFDGGSHALKLPLHLASNEFVPIVLGLARPSGKRNLGILKATQVRADGELSPGYAIEG